MTDVEDLEVGGGLPGPAGGIVVGDDGSEEATAALRWAADAAVQRKRPLHVVRAWTMRSAVRPAGWTPGYVPSMDEFAQACKESVQREAGAALEQWQGLDLHVHAVHGDAAKVLLAASRHAEMVVMGWRGRGLRDRLLGSVAETVTRDAACTVVIVRPFCP